MTRTRILRLALAASVASAALWAYHWRRSIEARDRHELWSAYLSGPVAQVLESGSEAHTMLRPMDKPWTHAQKALLGQQAGLLRRAWAQGSDLIKSREGDAVMGALAEAVRWQGELARLAEHWPRLDPRDAEQIKTALQAEEGFRQNMARSLATVKEGLRGKVLSRAEFLEANAMIYSLNEALWPPAGQSAFKPSQSPKKATK